jgi:hypothetical protein
MTVGVENVDKAIARARHIVVFFPVLLCIGDKEITVVLDTERGEPNWNVRIREVAVDLLRRRRPEAAVPLAANTSIVAARKFAAKRKAP